ncbi:MAG: hypothetical protein AB1Z98_05295, partial [Nannocystaceae bacterium]
GDNPHVASVTAAELEAGTELERRPTTGPVAVVPTSAGAVDPLWRPIGSGGAQAVVWDEMRCIVLDGRARIHDPDDGRLLFVVAQQGRVEAVPEPETAPSAPTGSSGAAVAGTRALASESQGAEPAPLDRAYEAAFPALACQGDAAEDALPTPKQGLARWLGYRAWRPQVRPLPGRAPWNPDAWQSRVESPEPEDGRLEPQTILRAMGAPHPRPPLAI